MPRPLKINRHGAHDIEIVWDDGRTVVYPSRLLRERCPCAMCRDEWTGERLVQPNLLPILVFPTKLEPVGRYAIQIHWSDNHSTGIYTWELLSELAGEIEAWRAAQQKGLSSPS